MKKITIFLFLLLVTPSLAQKTMVPLKDYKNKKNDVVTEGDIFIRCAAVSFYLGALYKNNKTISEKSNESFEYFKSKSSKHFQTNGKMTEINAELHFLKNFKIFTDKYFEDGQENHNKTKKFIIGYIAEDLEICNSM